MDIKVRTRAVIPTRLIADAADESSRRALGRLRPHVRDIRVTVTDRRLRPGTISCRVEVDLAQGTTVAVRSASANPVEAVSQAFEKAARSTLKRLREVWTRHRAAQFRQLDAMRRQAAALGPPTQHGEAR